MSRPSHAASRSDDAVHILLVDDQNANLLVLRTILEDLGYTLVEARSGYEALQLIELYEFAVALIDVKMPEVDGFETATLIRSRPQTAQLPIIFVTAFDSEEFPAVKAYSLGGVDYLVKPIVPEVLRAKVSGLVELHRQQLSARRQSELLRVLVESTIDYAIFLLDPEGAVASWNPGAKRLNGYEANEIIGRHFSVFYPQSRIDEHWPEHELQVARATGQFAEEGWRLRKDGSRFWASVTITALRDARGKLLGYSKITRDLSERKEAEESLRRASAELERRVEERTADLARANEQLKEADRRKDDFLAMLSHELRNPLAPIRNALQLMKLPGIEKEAAERAREMMERQLTHLVRIVDDLLEVSRIMRGKIQLRSERIELSRIFTQAIESAAPLIDAQTHDLVVSLPPNPIVFTGDGVRLAQAVTNLLVNAAKYTDKRGQIVLSGETADGKVFIRVKDTGVGISKNFLPRIFDLFAQAEQSLARSQGGLGIGLTLVKRIIELHNGTVTADSEGEGKGSVFTLTIPAAAGTVEARASAPAPEKSELPGPPRRVLVVDDNVDAAESTALLLRFLGHDVHVLHEGAEVVKTALDFHPEIILLDIGLPDVTGYDVARAIRAEPRLEGIVIAAVTGYGQDEDRKRSQEIGIDFHLTKPLALQSLTPVFARPDAH